MQAIEINAVAIKNHEIYLKLPDTVNANSAKVIVMYENDISPTVKPTARQAGSLKNQIKMRDDFDAPMDEGELALWYDSVLLPEDAL